MLKHVVAHLNGIVGPGVSVQGDSTAVPERGWRTGREDSVFLEVLYFDRAWVGQQFQITAFSSVQASMTQRQRLISVGAESHF